MPMNNGGTTATKWSEFEESVTVQDTPPDASTNFDALQQSQRFNYVFGPKQAYDPQGPTINLPDVEELDKGKHAFVWGWVVYRDIFPDTELHLSEYCLVFTNPKWSGPRHGNTNTEMRITNLPCQTHYCYDHECSDYSKRIQGFK
jgi:hypothetical protein